MPQKETLKIVDADSPSGFRVIFRDEIQPGDVKYFEPKELEQDNVAAPAGGTVQTKEQKNAAGEVLTVAEPPGATVKVVKSSRRFR